MSRTMHISIIIQVMTTTTWTCWTDYRGRSNDTFTSEYQILLFFVEYRKLWRKLEISSVLNEHSSIGKHSNSRLVCIILVIYIKMLMPIKSLNLVRKWQWQKWKFVSEFSIFVVRPVNFKHPTHPNRFLNGPLML